MLRHPNVARRARTFVVAIALASAASSCGDDAPSDASFDPSTVAWCGPVTWQTDGALPADVVAIETACARVALSVLDDEPWDGSEGGTRGRATRVVWTVDLADATGRSLAACRLSGEDDDGLDEGFTVEAEPTLSDCEVYDASAFGVTGGDAADLTVDAATLTRMRSGGEVRWAVDIAATIDVWGSDTGDVWFARLRSRTPIGLTHTTTRTDTPPPSVEWPRRGACAADGCWRVDYAEPSFDAGGDDASCTDIVDGLDPPTVFYLVRENGRFADNGLADVQYVPLPVDSCTMHAQDDTFWSTTLDFATGRARVTRVGAGTPSRCRIEYEGDMRACN